MVGFNAIWKHILCNPQIVVRTLGILCVGFVYICKVPCDKGICLEQELSFIKNVRKKLYLIFIVLGKTPSSSKSRRGRGPAVHEALQRIPATKRAIPMPNATWHAPGDSLFQCGPLDDRTVAFRQLESSSSDDDNMPDFGKYLFTNYEIV